MTGQNKYIPELPTGLEFISKEKVWEYLTHGKNVTMLYLEDSPVDWGDTDYKFWMGCSLQNKPVSEVYDLLKRKSIQAAIFIAQRKDWSDNND